MPNVERWIGWRHDRRPTTWLPAFRCWNVPHSRLPASPHFTHTETDERETVTKRSHSCNKDALIICSQRSLGRSRKTGPCPRDDPSVKFEWQCPSTILPYKGREIRNFSAVWAVVWQTKEAGTTGRKRRMFSRSGNVNLKTRLKTREATSQPLVNQDPSWKLMLFRSENLLIWIYSWQCR